MGMTALEKFNITSLPRWDNCSANANSLRDDLTKYFADEQERTGQEMDYYRLWNIGKGCEHGSALDQMTMTYTSFTGYLRYAGGFSASLSSAIASLIGAPRVLQAVGKDNIYPGIAFFCSWIHCQ